jgi:hypothetical protein
VDAGVRLDTELIHHATGAQDAQMLAHRWATRTTRSGQFARPVWAGAEQVDHLPTGRVSEGAEGGVKICNHQGT